MRRLACVLVLAAVAGCGDQRQDADEPEGEFRVEIVDASFPRVQHLAETVELKLRVRNAEREQALRTVAVTIETAPKGDGRDAAIAFGQQQRGAGLASAGRPVWILDEGPRGGDTAYVNTWLAGALDAGQSRELTWKLVASRAGTYTVRYSVAPGLTGRATAAAGRTSGEFRVRILDQPAAARVGAGGEVERAQQPSTGS